MKGKIIGVLLCGAIIFSCSKQEGKSQIYNFEDLVTDTLVLEKDEGVANISQSLTYMETDSGAYLFDFQNRQLLAWSFPEGKKVLEQFYMREGPDGVGDSPFKHLITKEGIFVIDAETKLIQANFEGEVVSRWQLPGVPSKRLYVNYTTAPNNPISKTGNQLLIADVPFVLKEEIMDYQNWILRYNLDDQTSSHISFSFPDKLKEYYDDPNLGPYSHYYNPTNGDLLVSFPVMDSLLVISEDRSQWVDASTEERLEILKGRTEQQGEYTVFLPDHNSGRYVWVTFDPVQKVYLRQVITGLRPESVRETKGPHKVKLVVLDEDFEKLGEVDMPENRRGFSTPEGYYYSIGNLGVEEKVGFVRLDFSKMK